MNKKLIIIILSAVVSIGIITGALITVQNREKPAEAATPEPKVALRPVTKAELAKADGKDGKDCYVAVDTTVYQIKDFSLWENGEHKTSGGRAYCGADMTTVISQSPHGHKVLDLLIEVGPLEG